MESYCSLKHGRLMKVAQGYGNDLNMWTWDDGLANVPILHTAKRQGLEIGYWKLVIHGKSVNWGTYQRGITKLRKNSTKSVKIEHHKNTSANRAKCL